jgi:hypothetical protein
MGWAYGRKEEGQKYLQDFGWNICWKVNVLKTSGYI